MTMNNQYDVNFFIEYFMDIPDERWLVDRLGGNGRHCAVGHCAGDSEVTASCHPMAIALEEILSGGPPKFCAWTTPLINDGRDKRYQQPTPKARILAALNDVKARAEAELEKYETRRLTLTPAKEQVKA